MESKTVGKVVAAFVAGVILALGGAIFYSRQAESVQASPGKMQEAVSPQALTTPKVTALPEAAPAAVVDVDPKEPEVNLPTPASIAKRPTAAVRKPKPIRPVVDSDPAISARAVSQRDEEPVALSPAAVARPGLDTQGAPVSSPAGPAVVQAPTLPIPAREPHVVTLPVGTMLAVRVSETLTSERNASGDTFHATLDSPIMADGFIIADRRSPVVGRVAQANGAGRVKGVANLVLTVAELSTTDGQHVPIATDSYEKWGSSSRKQDTAKIAGGAALGAILGAIAGGGKGAAIGAGAGGAAGTGVVLGTKGGPASISSETVLTFRLAHPVTLTEKFN